MKEFSAEGRVKTFYFLYFAAAAALMPYLALYYEQRGLGGRMIGILTSLPPIISLFSASLWSALGDITRAQRRILILTVAGTILSGAAIYFSRSFLAILSAVAVFALFNSPIVPLVDDSAMKLLKGREHEYGRLRFWGAVGWGLSAPLIGLLVQTGGTSWAFFGFMIFLSLGLLNVRKLPIAGASSEYSFKKGLVRLLKNPGWVLFLLIVFCSGVGMGTVHNYLFLYMNHVGVGSVMMGIALTVSTLSELLAFRFSENLIRKWGLPWMLLVSVLALIIRLIAYSYTTSIWLILIIQLSHGLTFSMLWVAGVAYANSSAPKGLETTAQGLFTGVAMGISVAVGAFVGGWLYEELGPLMMYRWTAIGIFVLMMVILPAWIAVTRRGSASR